ncbi:hypothetical protein LXL04_015524 [Taraxacum kok-saghyz]
MSNRPSLTFRSTVAHSQVPPPLFQEASRVRYIPKGQFEPKGFPGKISPHKGLNCEGFTESLIERLEPAHPMWVIKPGCITGVKGKEKRQAPLLLRFHPTAPTEAQTPSNRTPPMAWRERYTVGERETDSDRGTKPMVGIDFAGRKKGCATSAAGGGASSSVWQRGNEQERKKLIVDVAGGRNTGKT